MQGANVRMRNSCDPTEAEALLTASFCCHKLISVDPEQPFDFRHQSMDLPGCTLNLLQYGSEVGIRTDGFEQCYMLEIPISGSVNVEYGGDEFESGLARGLILSPGRRLKSYWRKQTRRWMLQLDRARVESRFAELSHRPANGSPVFYPLIEIDSDRGRLISALVSRFHDPTPEDDVDDRLDRLIDALLLNLPFEQGASIVPSRLSATPKQVKRVMDLFHQRFADKLSMPTIAHEVGASERAIYDGFRRYYGRTPLDVLTRIRMDAARQLLRTGNMTVSEVARQVGARHLGRFSIGYRAVFGHSPSEEAATPA
ncbi:MAG: AraC family transcriptional regulator [Ancalomicrobiaceae bacterium]|nr:AraC family transcriptional regulator [Ancalomicrobiaceae bacterium]